MQQRDKTVALVVSTVVVTVVVEWLGRWAWSKRRRAEDPTAHVKAKMIVGRALEGALGATQLYLGDRLALYASLRDVCAKDGTTTSVELAEETHLNRRWLREWMAQQAAMGILQLCDGEGDNDEDLRYKFPPEFADVLANPESKHYLISLVQMIPALVNRARTTLPNAFRTGVGQGYDDRDIIEAIDRAHAGSIRQTIIPKIIPKASTFLTALTKPGARAAELGCGAGNFLLALARKYPNAEFVGYEISDLALEMCRQNIRGARLKNATVKDARIHPLGSDDEIYDVVTTYDVLHDATKPAMLVQQVKSSLKPGGAWLLGDIACLESTRANVTANGDAAFCFALSTCLCLSCAVSEPGGAGLGTLGFSTPVALKMLHDNGFNDVKVISEDFGTRWFEAIV